MKFLVSDSYGSVRQFKCPGLGAVHDFKKNEWIIEVNTLEDLLALLDKEDEPVILWPLEDPGELWVLEVYNTHRE